MSKLVKSLAALATLAAALSAGPAAAQADAARTLKLSVNGMVCAFCAQGIEKRLVALPETGELYINLAQKVVAVEPKPGKTLDSAKVRAEIVDAGYDVTGAEMVPQTVAALRAEMKGRK